VRSKSKLPVCGTGAWAVITTISGSAYAATAAAPDDSTLSEVVVTGVRQALRDSITTKQNSNLIGDNISTKDIGQLPDVTIAEELNRLPGVNTTRDRGNASQASIRGLGPRLVLGLVNGREVASSEPSQDLRWEIYPSEVLSGAEVYKTQDASLVPGGIAATVDIRTISPLDYKGPEYSFRAGPTYNDESKGMPNYSGVGFRGSGGIIKHINDDFAVSLAGSVQREKNGFPDFRTFGWNTPDNAGITTLPTGAKIPNTGDLNGDGVPDNTTWGLNTEVKEVTQDRYAVAGGAGWQVSDDVQIKADALWSQYHIKENQFQTWYGNNITGNWQNSNAGLYNAPGNSYQIVNGSVVAANLNGAYPNVQNEIARYNEKHTLIMTGLNAEWKPGEWDNQADLSYSDAWRQNQWQAIYLTDVFAPNLAFNVTDGQVPYGATPGFDPANPAIQSVGTRYSNNGSDVSGTGQAGPEYTRDLLTALALSFGRTLNNPILSGVKFGARVSDREKTHHQSQWGLCPGTGSTSFLTPSNINTQVCPAGTAGQAGVPNISLANAGLSEFNSPSFTAPPLVYGNFDTLYPLVYPNAGAPAGSDELLLRTKVTERSYEGWFRLDFKSALGDMPLNGDVGLRVAHVKTESSGFRTFDGDNFLPISISNDYTNVLPSLNAVLHLTDTQQLRLGASIGIARPPLDSLTTGFSLSRTGNPRTGGGGNPKLDPYKADQFDLSYEWYFHEESLLAVAPFYKDVKTYIGASQSTQIVDGQTYLITSENNTKGGEIAGVELTFETRFFFLPGFLQDFGIYANHAAVESNIHEVAPKSNPYPMVGLAKGTSEADLFYNKGGFESRLAVKHHTAFTVAPTWVGTTLKQLAPETTLDASVSYTFATMWTVRVQGHNLTNERARFSADNNPQDLANDGGYQVYGRSYLFDVGVRF